MCVHNAISLSNIQVLVQPIGNDVKGRILSQQPQIQVILDDVPDIFNDGSVVATLLSNPTGSSLYGSNTVAIVMGVAQFTNLGVLPGGSNFSLKFTAVASDNSLVSGASDSFSCEGQEAVMNVLQQPLLTLRNDPLMGVYPLVEVLDLNGQRLTNANPLISVELGVNVVNASFTDDSGCWRRGKFFIHLAY